MDLPEHLANYAAQIDQLMRLAEFCQKRGWTPAGSCSFSLVVNHQPLQLLTTITSTCRGRLQPGDFGIVDDQIILTQPMASKSKMESELHLWLARYQRAQLIVQTHSVWSALLAERFGPLDGVLLEDNGLLQQLPNVDSALHVEWLPIIIRYDQGPLIHTVAKAFQEIPAEASHPCRAMVVQHHGMFTWAEASSQVQNQVEIFEYFCEFLVRRASIS